MSVYDCLAVLRCYYGLQHERAAMKLHRCSLLQTHVLVCPIPQAVTSNRLPHALSAGAFWGWFRLSRQIRTILSRSRARSYLPVWLSTSTDRFGIWHLPGQTDSFLHHVTRLQVGIASHGMMFATGGIIGLALQRFHSYDSIWHLQ